MFRGGLVPGPARPRRKTARGSSVGRLLSVLGLRSSRSPPIAASNYKSTSQYYWSAVKREFSKKNLRGKIPRAVSVRLPRDQSLRLIQRASPSPITLPKNTGLNKNRVYDSVFFFGVGYTYKVCHYSSNIIYP